MKFSKKRIAKAQAAYLKTHDIKVLQEVLGCKQLKTAFRHRPTTENL